MLSITWNAISLSTPRHKQRAQTIQKATLQRESADRQSTYSGSCGSRRGGSSNSLLRLLLALLLLLLLVVVMVLVLFLFFPCSCSCCCCVVIVVVVVVVLLLSPLLSQDPLGTPSLLLLLLLLHRFTSKLWLIIAKNFGTAAKTLVGVHNPLSSARGEPSCPSLRLSEAYPGRHRGLGCFYAFSVGFLWFSVGF